MCGQMPSRHIFNTDVEDNYPVDTSLRQMCRDVASVLIFEFICGQMHCVHIFETDVQEDPQETHL